MTESAGVKPRHRRAEGMLGPLPGPREGRGRRQSRTRRPRCRMGKGQTRRHHHSWPVSVPCLWTSWCQSLGVGLFGFFLGSFFLLFVFSLSFFSGFLNPKRAISPALSVWDTFAHAHRLPQICRQQVPKKKFGTIYHFDINLIRSRCAGHLLGVSHRSVSEKAEGTLQEMSNDGEASGFQVALFI